MKTTFLSLLLALMPLLGYTQCETTEEENVWHKSWLSCQTSPNPANPSMSTHWVQYDLGQVYQIDSLHLWNYNVDSSMVTSGINQYEIHTSLDSNNWTTQGVFSIGQATGSSTYLGQGMEFASPITAQYLILEIENNYGGECSGFSELVMGIVNDTCTNFQPEVVAEYDLCNDIFSLAIDSEEPMETYSILWSNGSNTSRISGLAEGDYHVAIESNVCTQVVEIELRRPAMTLSGWTAGTSIPAGTYSVSEAFSTSGSVEKDVDFLTGSGVEFDKEFNVALEGILEVYLVDCNAGFVFEQSRMSPRSNKITFKDYIGAGHTFGISSISSGQEDPLNSINGFASINSDQYARFLTQATFGMNSEMLTEIEQVDIEPWIDWQLEIPHESYFNHLYFISKYNQPNILYWTNWHRSWWNNVLTGEQYLRDRMAYALSQILVISSKSFLLNFGDGLTAYYDIISRNAFGNYRDLLLEVTLSPMMGFYLSHLNNPKTDAANNIFPDENYAREVLQLFSIGLYELNVDGTRKKDVEGNDIPTYDNNDIIEFAKVFTGLSLSERPFGIAVHLVNNRAMNSYMTQPMQMHEEHHEPGEKHLLNGYSISSGQTGMQDIEDAIDNIFNHPNVGPFLARRLIQRFVKSHPSSAYVQRVAESFNNNGEGVRGDLGAVIKAILMDEEARDCSWISDPDHGKLKEPLLRFSQLYKAFNLSNSTGTFYSEGLNIEELTGQGPLRAPSVFNFYQSDYSPPGVLSDVLLEAPEFQILNSSTSIGYVNMIDSISVLDNPLRVEEAEVYFQLDEELALAHDADLLVAHLNSKLTNGTLTNNTIEVIKKAINDLPLSNDLERVKMGIYLVAMSPEYAVLK